MFDDYLKAHKKNDDEVTAFFSPHATGKSAIFVVALGHTASVNRVRPFRSRLGMMIDALSRRDALESDVKRTP